MTSMTGVVAANEIRQRMRGRAFRIATGLVLAAVAAAIVIPARVSGSEHPQRVGVVGTLSATARAGLAAAARSAGTKLREVPEPDRAAATAALRAGRIDLAVVSGDTVLVKRPLSADDTSTTALLARGLAKSLGTEQAVRAAGLTAEQAATLAGARPAPIGAVLPARETAINKGAATVGAILVFLLLSQYLSWTLIGVMQEKANRVVEVLLATVRPVQLLAGKLLGIGAAVFLQAALVGVVAFVAARAVGSDLLHGATPLYVLGQLLWVVLGYAFYSWLYAGAGSMVERQDQVQSLAIPLVVPLVFGYIVAISAAGNGHPNTLLDVLAYLPPTAPFAMPVLVAMKAVTWWQFVLSVVITLAATLAAAHLAATVYRRAILRTGRRVRLSELRARAGAQRS